jgi:hypothetical protein
MHMNQNVLKVINPYQWNGLWVFDDEKTGLVREALIAGIDTMLDKLTSGYENAADWVMVLFSDVPFPGHQIELKWLRHGQENDKETNTGDWYYCPQLHLEGWLCPALLLYFQTPPASIYAMVKPKQAVPAPTTKTNNMKK